MTTTAEGVFSLLPVPGDEGSAFSAVVFNPLTMARVAKSRTGNPAFLVPVTDPSMAPIQLTNLRALFDVRCRIVVEGVGREESVTVVECTSEDPEVRAVFLRGLEPVISALEATPTAARTREAVEDLAELFRKLSQPPSRSIVGAWGELLLLAIANRPKELLRAWHVDPAERFDFLADDLRIEVKTTRLPQREHRVALEQLSDPGARVALASMRTQGAGGGTSLRELLDEIRSRLADDPAAQLKVMQGLANSLGTEWSSGMDVRFDRQLAESTLAFFDAGQIPSVAEPVPPEVTSVRFVVNLSACSPLSGADLESAGGIWAAAIAG